MRFVVIRIFGLLFLIILFWLYRKNFQIWKSKWNKKKWFRFFKIVYWVIGLTSLIPLVFMVFLGRNLWPVPIQGFFEPFWLFALAWFYTHFLGTLLLSPFILIYFLIYKLIKMIVSKIKNQKEDIQQQAHSVSRKDFLAQSFGILPAVLSTGLWGGFIHTQNQSFQTKHIYIPICQSDLDPLGLKIMQISDIHIGHLINENYLSDALSNILSSEADILVVTGDIIDNNNYYLDIAQKFFKQMMDRFPLGVYGVLGNHDLIDNGEKLSQSLTSVGIRMLRNETVTINYKQSQFHLMGLDYPKRMWRMPKFRQIQTQRNFVKAKKMISGIQQSKIKILLNHHPSDFDYFADQGVDLTLSGHTHGGQIDLGVVNPIGQFFPYNKGIYKKESSFLYVNSGLGHWFPLRIQCQPEITLLQLTKKNIEK